MTDSDPAGASPETPEATTSANIHAVADFRSDTLTVPTPAMRAAMAAAVVGDDVFDEDPTLHELQDEAAALFGVESALFTSSGTQANQIALACHAHRGEEILLEERVHPFLFEGGAIAWISGAQARPLPSERGTLDPAVVEAAIRGDNEHFPRTACLSVENTHNMHGGTVVPLANLAALRALCDRHGVALHLDGARLFNAIVASGTRPAQWGALADTISICLSKGLGAPVGSLLLGSRATIRRARRVRKVLGGGMRQAGILAAAGLIALREGPDGLAEDHRRARELAAGVREAAPGFTANEPETNMVYVRLAHGSDADYTPVVEALAARGVRTIALGELGMRFVTHREITDAHVAQAIAALAAVSERCLG